MSVGEWGVQPYSVFIRTSIVMTTYGSDYGGGDRDEGMFQKMSQGPRAVGSGLQGGCKIEIFRGKPSRCEGGSSHTLSIISMGSSPWVGWGVDLRLDFV